MEWEVPEQRGFLAKKKCDFVANERSTGGVLLPEFDYVTILRDPVDITLSNFYHKLRAYQENGRNMPNFTPYLDRWIQQRQYKKHPLLHMFCKKGEHDVDAALEMLKNFSAILFVDTYENDLVVMRDKFGWQDVDITTHRGGSKRNSSATEELDPRLRLLLEHDLKKDILFYQKARDIAREINTL